MIQTITLLIIESVDERPVRLQKRQVMMVVVKRRSVKTVLEDEGRRSVFGRTRRDERTSAHIDFQEIIKFLRMSKSSKLV